MKKIFFVLSILTLFICSTQLSAGADEYLKFVSAQQADYSSESGVVSVRLRLDFNLPVSPQRLSGFLSLKTTANKKINATCEGSLPSKSVYVSAKLTQVPGDNKIIVDVAKGFLPNFGSLGLEKDARMVVVISPMLTVEEAVVVEGETKISITTNQPVNSATAAQFIQISPTNTIRVEKHWDENKFLIIGNFNPRERVELTLKKGLAAKDGRAKLTGDFVKAFIFPDLPSEVELPSQGVYLSPTVSATVPVEIVNTGELEIKLWRLYESNLPFALRNSNYYEDFPRDMSALVAERSATVNAKPNERVRRAIDISALIETSADKRGVYLLSAGGKDFDEWQTATQVVALTDIGITARYWDGACVVWVNSISAAKPINNAVVKIYSSSCQLLAEGRTDNQGLCRYFYASPEAKNEPAVITVSNGGDISFLQLNEPLVNNETFDTDGREWTADKSYEGMIFTPRGIYRPGEKVTAKAFVREAGNKTPAPFPVLFIVKDALGRAVARESVMLSEQGGAAIEYASPESAAAGEYSVALYVPGKEKEDKPFAVAKFSVESFAPPRIEVKIVRESLKKFIAKGESAAIKISSQYLFGVPAANMPFEITYNAEAGDFVPQNEMFRAFKFGDPEKAGAFTRSALTFGEGNLDEDGEASASLESGSDWNPPTIVDLKITARVKEDSGRWITSEVATIKYLPNRLILGLEAPESVRTGAAPEFRAAALTGDKEEPAALDAKAILFKIAYHYNLVERDGVRRWQTTEEFDKVEEKPIKIENGAVKFDFAPIRNWGEYLVKIVSAADEKVSASSRFWCDDSGAPGGSRMLDKVELEFDKPSYKAGDTAKIRVRSPFAGTLLFTVENSKLLGQQVIEMPGVEVDVFFPISGDYVGATSNLWCAASVLRPVRAGEQWAAHRALGVKSLPIDNSDKKLELSLDALGKTIGGEKLSVKMKTAPNAEIALALVDEGVLQITSYNTPDPHGFFYPKREMSSNIYDIYDLLMQIESSKTELLHPSGGMAAKAAAFMGKVDAKRFKILSIFNPSIIADADGNASVELDIPEFSGRGRLFALAVSGESFASAEKFVQVGRDIIIEPNLPRFAALGDVFTSPLSVFNTTDISQDVQLSLSAEGGLEILTSGDIAVTLPPKGSKTFDVKFQAIKIGAAKYKVNEQEIELPIRGNYPLVTQFGTGSFGAGETEIAFPDAPDARGELIVSALKTAELAPAVIFLIAYPYRCLEQNTSRAWAALAVPQPETNRILATALATLQSMQLYDGSFALWAGNNQAFEWGSVYAAHFLSELRSTPLAPEINFPEDSFKGVMNYLRNSLANVPDGDTDKMKEELTAKAYACFVLALEKEPPLGWMYWLRENESNLLPEGRLWLAGAYSLAEGKSDALAAFPPVDDGNVKIAAQQLLLWTMIKPDANEAVTLARRLSEWNAKWFGTYENALAVRALARTASKISDIKCSIDGKVEITGSTKSIKITASGTGMAYYSWTLAGEPTVAPAHEARGLYVESVWKDKNGAVIDKKIALGQEIFVSLRVIPTVSARDVVVSVLLPAGFEIENAPLAEHPLRVEARDDRVLLFFDRLSDSVEYKYVVRAVTSGKFTLPPITAEGMYSPEYRFVGTGSEPEIVRK